LPIPNTLCPYKEGRGIPNNIWLLHMYNGHNNLVVQQVVYHCDTSHPHLPCEKKGLVTVDLVTVDLVTRDPGMRLLWYWS